MAGASGTLPFPSASLTPAWSRQRELLMHLLPWYTAAAAAAAQVQPGNQSECPHGAPGGPSPALSWLKPRPPRRVGGARHL